MDGRLVETSVERSGLVIYIGARFQLSRALIEKSSLRPFAGFFLIGLTLIQETTRMAFGYTCMALDPDGHRLRLYCPAPELS